FENHLARLAGDCGSPVFPLDGVVWRNTFTAEEAPEFQPFLGLRQDSVGIRGSFQDILFHAYSLPILCFFGLVTQDMWVLGQNRSTRRGQKNDKSGAFSGTVALGRNGAAVYGNEVPDDAQTEPKSFMRLEFCRLTLSEALENVRQLFPGDSAAVIGNCDLDHAIFDLRANPDLSVTCKADRVRYKVRKNLP